MTRRPVCVTREGLQSADRALQDAQSALHSAAQSLRQNLYMALPQVDAAFAAELNAYAEGQVQLVDQLYANWQENRDRVAERMTRLSDYWEHSFFADDGDDTPAYTLHRTLSLGEMDGDAADTDTYMRDGYRVAAKRFTPPPESPFVPGDVVTDVSFLPATRQPHTQARDADDVVCDVYDNPDALSCRVVTEQGINRHNLPKTCVCAALANWLCNITGHTAYDEDAVVDYACRAGYSNRKGGICIEDVPKLWAHFGLRPECVGVWDAKACAAAVESGRAVGLSVRGKSLWYGWGWGRENTHMIDVVSVKRGPGGEIRSFYIVDTGRGKRADACREVPVRELEAAIRPRNFLMIFSGGAVW